MTSDHVMTISYPDGTYVFDTYIKPKFSSYDSGPAMLPPMPSGFSITTTSSRIVTPDPSRHNTVEYKGLVPYGLPTKVVAERPILNNGRYQPIDPWKQSREMQVELAVQVARADNPNINERELSLIRHDYKQDINYAERTHNLLHKYKDYEWFIHPYISAQYPDRWVRMGIRS